LAVAAATEYRDFVLTAFSGGGNALKDLDDPQDPLELLENNKGEAGRAKMPKLNRDHWEAALKLNDEDPIKAKTWIDRTLSSAIGATKKGRSTRQLAPR
jgi:hypothetical protein